MNFFKILFTKLLLATLIMFAIGDHAIATCHYKKISRNRKIRHYGAKDACPKCHSKESKRHTPEDQAEILDKKRPKVEEDAAASATTTVPQIALGQRPATVQAAVDKAFEEVKDNSVWGLFDGEDSRYCLFGFDEDLLVKSLVSKNKEDIYIIDVGCASGGWGRNAMRVLLRDEVCRQSGKQFYIFSVTGGTECKDLEQHEGNVSLYQFSQFKIENIDEKFSKRGFNLANKVDLIVSNWTLRHLVDPFGTLKRMYSLLTPQPGQQGMLVSSGFLFAFNDSEEVQSFPHSYTSFPSWNILAATNTNAVPLFCFDNRARNTGQFLLMRNNDQELEIPLEYTGKIRHIGKHSQCSSQVVTVFKKGAINQGEYFVFKPIKCKKDKDQEAEQIEDGIFDDHAFFIPVYCDTHNQLSKDLHARLKRQELFSRPLV